MKRANFIIDRPYGWRNRLGWILVQPLVWLSKRGRQHMRYMRALEKAQKARNAGDATAMERFWRDDLTHAVASSNPLDRAKALQHLGSDLMNQRRFSEAEQSIKESQEIARQAEGPAGFWSLGALNRLGWIAEHQGRESEAEAHFLEALHTAEKELGPEHHRVAFELLGLANFYHSHGRGADELAAVERMATIEEKNMAEASRKRRPSARRNSRG